MFIASSMRAVTASSPVLWSIIDIAREDKGVSGLVELNLWELIEKLQ